MRVRSWEAAGLSQARMLLVLLGVGVMAAVSVLFATRDLLGGASYLLGAAVGGLACYVVAGYPRRSLERSTIMQAREAPLLAASAAVYLRSTGSRSKTLMMLHSDEARLGELLEDAKRSTLLGYDAASALGDMGRARADSVSSILGSVAKAQAGRLADEGEELEGLVRASVSGEETKFPVFLTISFFLPIMLMLVAALGHRDDPLSVVSLAFVEVVVLDLALAFTSTERRKLAS